MMKHPSQKKDRCWSSSQSALASRSRRRCVVLLAATAVGSRRRFFCGASDGSALPPVAPLPRYAAPDAPLLPNRLRLLRLLHALPLQPRGREEPLRELSRVVLRVAVRVPLQRLVQVVVEVAVQLGLCERRKQRKQAESGEW